MGSDLPQNGNNSDSLLAAVVDELTNRLQAGESVDLEVCVARHPERAEEIRALLPTLQLLGHLAQASGPDGLPHRPFAEQGSLDDPSPPIDGTLGDFRIRREIGRGGMGVVYEAEQISLRRRVALKVLPFAAVLDPRQLQRFKNEAQAAASLDHPNIVSVFSVGCERGVHYYAMQYVEGHTLAQLIAEMRRDSVTLERPEGSPLSPRREPAVPDTPRFVLSGACQVSDPTEAGDRHPSDGHLPSNETVATLQVDISTHRVVRSAEFFRLVANLGIQAAEALEHAHQLGVVHRDIKPSNLLLDAEGHLSVTDFGLARTHLSAELTMTGDLLGTLRYMSPEQASGNVRVLDHRTDIYSLGITLYELLTLRPAFPQSDRLKLLRQISSESPPAPRKSNLSIPQDLETIVLKSLSNEPHHRYATARDLSDDLRRFLDHKPIAARRVSSWDRLRKWSWRHQAALWALIVFLFCFAVGATVSTVAVLNARRETVGALARADAHLKIARATVDEYLTQVSESTLLDVPSLQPLRRELLEMALRYYQDIIATYGDESGPDDDLGSAYHNLGSILLEIGDTNEALSLLEAALRVRERLVLADPKSREHQGQLTSTQHALGQLFTRMGRHTEARNCFETVLSAHNALLSECPGDTTIFGDLANAHINLGHSRHKTEERDDAVLSYRSAIDYLHAKYALSRQVETSPNAKGRNSEALQPDYCDWTSTDRARLLVCYINLGVLHKENNDLRSARELYEEAREIADLLVADYPGIPRFRQLLAGVHNNLGTLARHQGNLPDAIAAIEAAVDVDRMLTTSNPDVLPYRLALADRLQTLGGTMMRAGRNDGAIVCLEESIAVLETRPTDEPTWHSSLGSAYHELAVLYNRLGRLEAALDYQLRSVRTVEALMAIDPSNLEYRRAMSVALEGVSNRQWQLDLYNEARESQLQSLAIIEKDAADYPDHAGIASLLASSYVNLAAKQMPLGDLEGAIDASQKAITVSNGLVGKFPDVPDYQETIGMAYHNLGLAQRRLGRLDDAASAFRAACDLFELLSRDHETVLSYREYAAGSRLYLANAVYEAGETAQAHECYQVALDKYRLLFEENPEVPLYANRLAWNLAACPIVCLRDSVQAVELAEKAVVLAAEQGTYWRTLGVARYFAGQWNAAVEALDRSVELDASGMGFVFLAMAHWHSGEHEQARLFYEQARQWITENEPADNHPELLRFAAEAAELIGIAETDPDAGETDSDGREVP